MHKLDNVCNQEGLNFIHSVSIIFKSSVKALNAKDKLIDPYY